MKATKQILFTLAVNSSFVHIVFHIQLWRRNRESAISALKGVGREFTRFYII